MNIIAIYGIFVLYHMFLLEIIEAARTCKVPNGDAGTCIPIATCPPLLDLSNTKYKTQHENMYLQQSFCSRPGNKVKVCCPSQSVWNKFDPNPVLYPEMRPARPPRPVTNTPLHTTNETPAIPVPLAIPSVTGSRIYEESNEEEDVKTTCGIDKGSLNKIFGGDEVALDQYPWLALLQFSGDILACGGSLISHKFVLTAAHCLRSSYGPPLFVRLAEYNTSSFPTDYKELEGGGIDESTVEIIDVKKSYVHPNWSRFNKINDIGLTEMLKSVAFTSDFIKPICLPGKNFIEDFGPTTNFTIAGWGRTEFGKDSEIKLEVSIPYVPVEECKKDQNPEEMATQICAGGIEGKDSCNGDSGGPLMYLHMDRFYVVGVLSYGNFVCGKEGKPATHTNVYKYITWIKETMSGNTRI